MPTRAATAADRPRFLHLWKRMYEEQHQYGSDIPSNDDTMKEIAALFDAYTRGSLFGVVMVWTPEEGGNVKGVAMAGEAWGGVNLGTTSGKQAEGWGIYVVPKYRKRGGARELQEACEAALERLAFDCVVSHVFCGNEAGAKNLEGYGWEQQAVRYIKSLGGKT